MLVMILLILFFINWSYFTAIESMTLQWDLNSIIFLDSHIYIYIYLLENNSFHICVNLVCLCYWIQSVVLCSGFDSILNHGGSDY